MKSRYFDDFAEGFWEAIRLYADIVLAVGAVLSAFVNNLPSPIRALEDAKSHSSDRG